MAAAVSHNIANAGTPGYRRVDAITAEMNFSGPGNVPFLPAGVRTVITSPDQPWLDNRLALALNQSSTAQGYVTALRDFAIAADTGSMERAFSQFMVASQDALMNPTDSPVVERFQATLQGMIVDFNQFSARVEQAVERLALGPDQSGVQAALRGPIEAARTKISDIMSGAVRDINQAYGEDIIQQDSQGRWQLSFVPGGDFAAVSEYGSQQFNTDLGAVNSELGVAQRGAERALEFAQTELQGAEDAWNQVYGVDLVQEAVKLREIEIYQQANALAAKTASDMIGVLLEAFA